MNEGIKHLMELQPDDGQKSFYGKAQVINAGRTQELYSYGTLVCRITGNLVELFPKWSYSLTTTKHLSCFLRQNGFNVRTKKDIEKLLNRKVFECSGD